MRRNIGSYHQFIQTLSTCSEAIYTSLPEEFTNIPFGEKTGLVVQNKTISVRGDIYPFNASIIKKEPNGYHMVFRYDVINEASPFDFDSFLGYVKLDNQWNQTEEEFVTLSMNSQSPEDPRILRAKNQDYLVFNDLGPSKGPGRRYMHIGKIDLENQKVENILSFNPSLQFIEKNWVPFEYINETGNSDIYFEYSISPLKLLKIDDSQNSSITHMPPLQELKEICWPRIWGKIRGGTPAQKVDGQYLAFFHSSFKDRKDILWYCFAAYTFEENPPFRITGISHYPILFEGIYTTPYMNTADPLKRVIFPCSFVVDDTREDQVIHVSCGENDSHIKIITLDKKELLKGLKKIKIKKLQ